MLDLNEFRKLELSYEKSRKINGGETTTIRFDTPTGRFLETITIEDDGSYNTQIKTVVGEVVDLNTFNNGNDNELCE